MLKGFIDLVFCWQGKYYLLDYKSNWLGKTAAPIPVRRWSRRWRCIVTNLQSAVYAGAASLSASSVCRITITAPFLRVILSVPARRGMRRTRAMAFLLCLPEFPRLVEGWSLVQRRSCGDGGRIKIALLEQAAALRRRAGPIQFRPRWWRMKTSPIFWLAAACLSAEAGAGHVRLMLEQLQADALFEGASRLEAAHENAR